MNSGRWQELAYFKGCDVPSQTKVWDGVTVLAGDTDLRFC